MSLTHTAPAIAATHTHAALARGPITHQAVTTALTAGHTRAFMVGAIIAGSAALIGLIAVPRTSKATGWWGHAICAALGQPWPAEAANTCIAGRMQKSRVDYRSAHLLSHRDAYLAPTQRATC